MGLLRIREATPDLPWGPLCRHCRRDRIDHCDDCSGCWVLAPNGHLDCPLGPAEHWGRDGGIRRFERDGQS